MAETYQEPDLAYFQNVPSCAQLLSSPDVVIAAMQVYNTAEWLQENTTEQKMYAIYSIAILYLILILVMILISVDS